MSANSTNAGLELVGDVIESLGPVPLPEAAAPEAAPTYEAFQALLAFSSLQQQVRAKRGLPTCEGAASSDEVRAMEQFVLDEVLQIVAERSLTITGCDGIAIALADGDEIVCRASAGSIAPDAGARLNPNSGFSGSCFRSAEIVRCDDVENDARVNVQAARRLSARSMIAVPLAGQQSVLGLLEAFSYDAYAFNDSDVRSLKLLAELILAAMRPEEEDRLAQISRAVSARAAEIEKQDDTSIRQESALQDEDRRCVPEGHEPPLTFPADSEAAVSSRPGLLVVCAIVLFAALLGGGAWWGIRHKMQTVSASLRSPRSPALRQQAAQEPQSQVPEDDLTTAGLTGTETDPLKQQLSVLPQVRGIRHWSSADSSSIAIDLQDQVQYEAHRLTNPERIYFDLHDTSLAPGLLGKTIEIGDTLVVRVRVAQPMPGVTRVVLDTKGGSNFSVSLESDPYRLVVEVRRIGAGASTRSKVDLFAPVTPVNTGEARAHMTGPRIVLDAGHGGWDLGTVGRQGLLEKDLTLDVVERLGNLLQNRLGAEVVYTRKDDSYIALERRAEIANQERAELFLSVHANYSDLPSARGVETYYTNTFSSVNAHSHDEAATLQGVSFANVDIREKVRESHRFAASVQRALFATLTTKNPGIRNRGVKEAGYVVLTGTSMPAILAEISFVSSPADELQLQDSAYRQEIAQALYKGVAGFVGKPRPVKMAAK